MMSDVELESGRLPTVWVNDAKKTTSNWSHNIFVPTTTYVLYILVILYPCDSFLFFFFNVEIKVDKIRFIITDENCGQ